MSRQPPGYTDVSSVELPFGGTLRTGDMLLVENRIIEEGPAGEFVFESGDSYSISLSWGVLGAVHGGDPSGTGAVLVAFEDEDVPVRAVELHRLIEHFESGALRIARFE